MKHGVEKEQLSIKSKPQTRKELLQIKTVNGMLCNISNFELSEVRL